jgi:hypothetical protein
VYVTCVEAVFKQTVFVLEIIETVGFGRVLMVIEFPPKHKPFKTPTEYVVLAVGATVIVGAVEPVDHEYVVAALFAVKVTVRPEQTGLVLVEILTPRLDAIVTVDVTAGHCALASV